MTVALDVVSIVASGTGDRSYNHVTTASPAGIYTFILAGTTAGTTDIVVGACYGGIVMAEDTVSPIVKTAVERMQAHLFKLETGVPSGSQIVNIDVNTADNWMSGTISLTAAGAVEVVDSDNSINSNSIVSPSTTLSLGGRTSFCAIGLVSGQNAVTGISPRAGWTVRDESDFGGQSSGIYTYDTIASTDVVAGWTQTAEDAIAIAFAVSEVVVAGGGTPPPGLLQAMTGITF